MNKSLITGKIPEQIDGPAKVEPTHIRDRSFRNEQGQIAVRSTAWRRLTPLQAVYAKDKLAGGNPKYLAQHRYDAGKRYSEIFDAAQPSSRDSTDVDRVSKSASGAAASHRQAVAVKFLAAVHLAMGRRDRQIVEMVCGQGYWPSEAVRTVCGPDYTKAIIPRFREALDALIEAQDTARARVKSDIVSWETS